MTRRHSLHRINRNRTYTYEEICRLLSITKVTIWKWTKEGLPLLDGQIPRLIHGSALHDFLKARAQPRQPLKPGEIYCVACKRPRVPVDEVALFLNRAPTNGDIIGVCPSCGRDMYRRVRLSDLASKVGSLTLVFEDG